MKKGERRNGACVWWRGNTRRDGEGKVVDERERERGKFVEDERHRVRQ